MVSIAGTRSRARPSGRSRAGVVAASVSETSTPRVPFTRMPHAAYRPGIDSDNPRTVTRAPPSANGSSTASVTNGNSISIRGPIQRREMPAIRHSTIRIARYAANAQNTSRGVATTAKTNATAHTILTSAGSRCTGEAPSRYRGWA